MKVAPMTVKGAAKWAAENHRHHKKPKEGALFACRLLDEQERTVAVAIAARPEARMLDDKETVEIIRVATGGQPNACSQLYGALCRAAKAIGYEKAITYTLASEPGTSLRAAGFKAVHLTKGGSWDRAARPRKNEDHPTGPKVRWERNL